MIITFLCALIISAFFNIIEKSGWFGLIYLATLPFIVFSGQSPLFLTFSLLLGYLLYCLLRKPSLYYFTIFIIVLITSITVIHPRSGLDLGMLNAINAQRGEHPGYESTLLPKLLHNKTDLFQSYVNNFDKLLSPVAIFASGFWHKISPYYPLGFLFPWDLYFIYRFFMSTSISWSRKSNLYFLPALFTSLLLSGFVYIDQAEIYAFGVVYFLAILALLGYSKSTVGTRFTFLFLNSIYLVYHLVVTSYFPI